VTRAGCVVLGLVVLVAGMVFDVAANGQEVLVDFAEAFAWEPPYRREPGAGDGGAGAAGPARYTFDGQVAEELPPGLERLIVRCARPGHFFYPSTRETAVGGQPLATTESDHAIRIVCGDQWSLSGSYQLTVAAHTREQAEAYARKIEVVFELRDDRTGVLSITEPKVRPYYVEWISTDHLTLHLPRNLDLEIVSQGSLSIEGLNGSLTCFNTGHAVIADILGEVDLKNMIGLLRLRSVGGTARVTCVGGTASLENLKGDLVFVAGGMSGATVCGVRGHVRAEATHGSLDFSGVGGGLELTTSGSTVRVKDVAGPVTAETTGGHVSLSGLRAATRVSVKMGSLRLALDPTPAGYAVTASILGNFSSDFPLESAPSSGDSLANLVVTGTIGAGEIPVDIEVVGGSLQIVEGE